ncbi:MAG: diguanylate cyclase [Desulfobulbaceae bacterium]|nr:diguanylate cyclase [Desulfobulbaceae bacterium]
MEPGKKDEGLVGWVQCQQGNYLGCFLRKCLDTSIVGKLSGILVVSLVGIFLLITINFITLNRVQKLNHDILSVNIPQYKVTQVILRSINGFKISLLHILAENAIGDKDSNVIANQQRLQEMEMMILALKNGGSVMDVAKLSQSTLGLITIDAPATGEDRWVIEEIKTDYDSLVRSFNKLVAVKQGTDASGVDLDNALDELLESLDDLHTSVTSLAVEINKHNDTAFSDSAALISTSQNRSIVIGLVVAIILVIGSVLYIILIVLPLKNVTEKVRSIASGKNNDLGKMIDIKTHDEIGLLAQQLNILIDNIFSINTFKAVIEEEESTTEVNQRLASVILDRFGLVKMFIYETTSTKNSMNVAYSSDPRNICSTQILDDGNFCRAKRTGHDISSVQYPSICKVFPHADCMEHHCIPMVANGRVVGVVQFLCDKQTDPEQLKYFEEQVQLASRYIKEATPVIEAKRFASALQETTLKDPMTDLYNRRFLETYTDTLVASTLRRRTKVGILMCDMDFFKEVNDGHGHEAGDVVLIKTAEILKSCVRASDMVIRYGGEEFLVLLIDIKSRDDIDELAERIRTSMEATSFTIPDGVLKKTISIGYSEFPQDSEGFWESIKFADVALYQAKQSGRNRVVGFSKEMWDRKDY